MYDQYHSMLTDHIQRATELLKDRGAIEFYRGVNRFIQTNARKHTPISQTELFLANIRVIALRNQILYDAPAHPFDTIVIDPSAVTYRSKLPSSRYGLGRIKGGDWDQRGRELLREHPIIKGLNQRFNQGKDWTDTIYYTHAKTAIEENGEYLGYRTIDTFLEQKCAFVERLYSNINEHGYQQKPTNQSSRVTESDQIVSRKSDSYKDNLEILVQISRDGDIYLQDGHHRIAIARILNIDQIPAHVVVRHKQWQILRDSIYDGDLSTRDNPSLDTHPDLQDLIA